MNVWYISGGRVEVSDNKLSKCEGCELGRRQ